MMGLRHQCYIPSHKVIGLLVLEKKISDGFLSYMVGWLCWGLTSQSTIFQSCRDGAIASWVINQYFRGVKCLAQGHNTAAVGLEPRTSRSGVRHSTTEPPLSPLIIYGCGGHLGHMTQTLRTNFRSPIPLRLHMKFGFDWPSGFGEEDIWKWWMYWRWTDRWWTMAIL